MYEKIPVIGVRVVLCPVSGVFARFLRVRIGAGRLGVGFRVGVRAWDFHVGRIPPDPPLESEGGAGVSAHLLCNIDFDDLDGAILNWPAFPSLEGT